MGMKRKFGDPMGTTDQVGRYTQNLIAKQAGVDMNSVWSTVKLAEDTIELAKSKMADWSDDAGEGRGTSFLSVVETWPDDFLGAAVGGLCVHPSCPAAAA